MDSKDYKFTIAARRREVSRHLVQNGHYDEVFMNLHSSLVDTLFIVHNINIEPVMFTCVDTSLTVTIALTEFRVCYEDLLNFFKL